VSGGQSFFDRAEIKDLCAWLRLLVNNDDDPAFLRAATSPKRGIGHQTLSALGEFASKWRLSLFEALFADSLHTALPRKSLQALHEFGRGVNDLEYRARHATGAEAARALLGEWLRAIGYEQHLHDGEEQAKLAEARWANVLEFVDWIARRCGGEVAGDGSGQVSEAASVLQVAQTISLMQSIAERGDDADAVTLSTLHAAQGLEWPHVMLAGFNEGLLPFANDEQPLGAQRLEEERRLMYVGVTRARQTLVVSSLKRRRRGRETVAAQPSRFVAEMRLDETTTREDPRERLKRLRAELAARAAAPATP
jgi:ATP-dependent DNA helicase Rep